MHVGTEVDIPGQVLAVATQAFGNTRLRLLIGCEISRVNPYVADHDLRERTRRDHQQAAEKDDRHDPGSQQRQSNQRKAPWPA